MNPSAIATGEAAAGVHDAFGHADWQNNSKYQDGLDNEGRPKAIFHGASFDKVFERMHRDEQAEYEEVRGTGET